MIKYRCFLLAAACMFSCDISCCLQSTSGDCFRPSSTFVGRLTSAFVRYPCHALLLKRPTSNDCNEWCCTKECFCLWDLKSSFIIFQKARILATALNHRCAKGLALCLGRQTHGAQRESSRFTLVLHTYDIGSTGNLPAGLVGFDPPYKVLEVFFSGLPQKLPSSQLSKLKQVAPTVSMFSEISRGFCSSLACCLV